MKGRPRRNGDALTHHQEYPMPTQLLTPAETADHLRVSTSTLADWRYKRTGPAYVRQGRVVRYPTDALAAWAATHEVTASA